MTQAKAATVVSALVTAGYVPSVANDGNTPANWTIAVSVPAGVSASTVASFATGQTISATVLSVVFN